MYGFLLAAGLGTRLRPLSDERAKPAFPFLGRPLVGYGAALLSQLAIKDAWVNTHYLPQTVEQALLSDPAADALNVHFIHEPAILGTGGALLNLKRTLPALDQDVLVVNAKIVADLDLQAASAAHRQTQACVTMVVVANSRREHFTHVAQDESGRFAGLTPAERLSEVAAPYVFTGIQILAPEFFDLIKGAPAFCDTVRDLYPLIERAGRRIQVHVANGSWSEFSTLERYLALHLQHTVGRGYVDASAQVAANARVQASVIWPRAVVGEGAVVERCLIGEGVRIEAGAHLSGEVVTCSRRSTLNFNI